VAIEKLYELPEFAELTGLKLGTVRQYVSNGIIPALYLGRKRVVPASVVERICSEGLKTKKQDGKSS
jgi:excisionase family DNA binding protein